MIATTTIVGDVVREVGGETIDLTVLLPVGVDPHGFDPAPADIAAVADADVIFLNGLGLEAFLAPLLESAGGQARTVEVSDGIQLEEHDHEHEDDAAHEHEDDAAHEHEDDAAHEHEDDAAHEHEDDAAHEHEDDAAHEHEDDAAHEHEDDAAHEHEDDAAHEHEDDAAHEHGDDAAHEHENGDPHVWTDPINVTIWAQNIARALGELDPDSADTYQARALAYQQALAELDTWVHEQVAKIPEEDRQLVSDHAMFGYFAGRYGFEQVGAIVPGYNSLAEPSARELAALETAIGDLGVKAVFVSNSMNPGLAERVAADTDTQLVFLYTGSLGEPGGDAGTYIDYVRYNVNAIVRALR